ncbi:UDP-N-acetylglucosamine-N-acetylmuramylpentapeptide N-acetylglucosamine transferase [Cellulophaga sp. RHA19]|uniref:undecaprenyldiphospho-muramoylpentapeptide beta-N-acetylglucosaminyltransferase n=1 Tax=Cellulophaga sp. RHA19 TaxID=1798237 RepID=UPI000C2C81DF|nr:undecaprenyldiphospho-muramoylpentapeptide beta-N-acetylglucosaminyltransferase [Cellulophaga sp. RHA19]PKB41961.1 UDP-N-acetylglucosamine-N-acetylmuramylpentapeptide N-acetylglucosamine transferase [Cellulophaga sp. RHA19]
MDNYKFILSGGGTGGHIYPAIAIANELKEMYPDAEFLFVGAKDRMEMEKVPQAGYKIEGLWISGFQRKLTFKNMLFPFKVISSLFKARQIIKKFKPNAVVGTGGFASGPLLHVAAGKNIPCVLQEQNSYAGVTNKLLAGKVQKICVAYDGMDRFFSADKIIKTGNPVRKDLVEMKVSKQKALEFFKLKKDKPVLLVLGGSLGARRVNKLIKEQLPLFASLDVQVIWQCGKLYYEEYKECQNEHVLVFDFLNKMDFAYAAADVIISRAGAGSVSELSIVGKPVIFIPSPNVAEDHQTKNALAYADKNAAILLREKELDASFKTVFTDLFNNKEKQIELGENIKKQALPNATKNIALEVSKLLKK